ncbi:YfbU family protein [Zhihengliuella salsuginis]|uniref:Ribbon-helix-helix protein CopG domain-containing protein n=1 Tax=Zhihengliuella salsuginis TaxID=578222 RepID=A0ABQ3GN38_9MICC|nr:YfbU family protein [Zhihengliuella salsuginis]GHD13178.1 hypothetical protein GCM10008096_29150 [Zhihengliuella salsuginis]
MATITIRVPDETRNRLEAAAESQGVSFSDYIRGALDTHLSLERSEEIGTGRREGDEEINLSHFERKVLQLLHRNLLASQGLLNDQYFDEGSEVRALKVLENGFAGEYSEEFTDINAPMTKAECTLVWDVLDMFRVIENSVRQLGEDGWGQVQVVEAERYGTFKGFDFNDSLESRLANYVEFLVKAGRWEEQKEALSRENDFGNSHRRMLPTYRAMLRVFKPTWQQALRGGATSGCLSREQVTEILAAAPGAEKRA